MTRRDGLSLGLLLVVAALLRFIGLDGRGTWDADQGHDMLVVRSFVVDGVVPLLGPPTSIGTFHHGALYYWLLAPAGLLSGADPTGVTAFIALCGLGTVAATFFLARWIGGTRAGVLAGLFTTLSPAAIEQSTFIWNPNLIPVAAAFGLAAAWRAWSRSSPRWWAGASVGVGIVMQCHVLGVILLPPVVALWIAGIRRAGPAERGDVLRAGLLGAVLVALMYVPLAIHELTHDFAETKAILAWISSGGGEGPPLVARLPIVAWRVLAWPLAGLITDRPLVAGIAALAVLLAVAARLVGAQGPERVAVRWLSLTLLWTILALTVAAPSLATIVPGLPNDHYHAFADPIVLVLVALAIAAILPAELPFARMRSLAGAAGGVRPTNASGPAGAAGPAGVPAARAAAALGAVGAPDARAVPAVGATEAAWPAGGVGARDASMPESPTGGPAPAGATGARVVAALGAAIVIGALELSAMPQWKAWDGGWPAAEQSAARIASITGGRPIALLSLPSLKSADAVEFPLVRSGATIQHPIDFPGSGTVLVVVCDPRFTELLAGGTCDQAIADEVDGNAQELESFVASPQRTIRIYAVD